MEIKTTKQIRNRESYKRFQKIYEIIESNKPIGKKLWTIYDLLEQYQAFGSQTSADYCKQSIQLLLKDKKK